MSVHHVTGAGLSRPCFTGLSIYRNLGTPKATVQQSVPAQQKTRMKKGMDRLAQHVRQGNYDISFSFDPYPDVIKPKVMKKGMVRSAKVTLTPRSPSIAQADGIRKCTYGISNKPVNVEFLKGDAILFPRFQEYLLAETINGANILYSRSAYLKRVGSIFANLNEVLAEVFK